MTSHAATCPAIGVVPSFGIEKWPKAERIETLGLWRDYLETLSRVGSVPGVLNPGVLTTEIIELCDGLVITGEDDIDPSFYCEDKLATTEPGESSEQFLWESELIEAADGAKLPILGICYGMQRLNVDYGGALLQDIDSQVEGAIDHYCTTHAVMIESSFLGLEKKQQHEIVSPHHQAVSRITEDFTTAAATSDGVKEAFTRRDHRDGIRWHPESDPKDTRIYRAYTEICERAHAL